MLTTAHRNPDLVRYLRFRKLSPSPIFFHIFVAQGVVVVGDAGRDLKPLWLLLPLLPDSCHSQI